jgi:hypothetical protein
MPPDGGLGPVPLFETAPACQVTAALKAAPGAEVAGTDHGRDPYRRGNRRT